MNIRLQQFFGVLMKQSEVYDEGRENFLLPTNDMEKFVDHADNEWEIINKIKARGENHTFIVHPVGPAQLLQPHKLEEKIIIPRKDFDEKRLEALKQTLDEYDVERRAEGTWMIPFRVESNMDYAYFEDKEPTGESCVDCGRPADKQCVHCGEPVCNDCGSRGMPQIYCNNCWSQEKRDRRSY